jgi:NADPH:quinone reductase-like Zn-dependent oxidoreductase
MGLMLRWKPFNRDDVATLEELIGAGKLRPAIDRRFALEDTGEALSWVHEGRAKGKVVIVATLGDS